MKRLLHLLAALTFLVTGACATMKQTAALDTFSQSSRDYIRLIRWDEAERAAYQYVAPEVRKEYLERVTAASGVKVADYRVKLSDCDPVVGKATVKVEFDYFRPPSTKMKTVVDMQQWRYVEGGSSEYWLVESLYPLFE